MGPVNVKPDDYGLTAKTVIETYPALWQKMITEWSSPDAGDRAWLLYSANYLFLLAGMRWVMDPVTLHHRLPSAPEVNVAALSALDYIVLTHEHKDHLDLELLFSLKEYPARWIVPSYLHEQLQCLEVPEEKMIIAEPGKTLHLGGVDLTPFDGLHWEYSTEYPGGKHGVPATGYLLEFNQKRWLIPGDTRNYDPACLPVFGDVDGLISHLWLGRGQALEYSPAIMDAFGRFNLGLRPGRIVVTHLNEWGRPVTDRWDEGHALVAMKWFKEQAPGLPISYAMMGDSFPL